MKVLLLAPEVSFPPPLEGGGEIFLHNICVQLKHLGHHVEVLTASKEGDTEFDVQQLYLVRRYPVYPSRLCTAFINIIYSMFYALKEHVGVILIGHFMTVEALGVWILWKVFRIPYVILIHGLDLKSSLRNKSRINKLIVQSVLKNTSLALANSYFTMHVIAQAGYDRKIVVLNPGVDTERFHPGLPTSHVRQKYGISSKKVILSVSRLVRRKGHANVLQALPLVGQQVPNVVYVIGGCGEMELELQTLVENLGLQEYVRFAGYIDDAELPHLYCACDVFVLPAIHIAETGSYEGFGIVFSEANACARPTIGGKSGGMSDSIVDGVTGILVDPHNVNAIANAVIRLLTDDQYAQALGKRGRIRVEKELSWPIVGKRLERALQSLTRDRRREHLE